MLQDKFLIGSASFFSTLFVSIKHIFISIRKTSIAGHLPPLGTARRQKKLFYLSVSLLQILVHVFSFVCCYGIRHGRDRLAFDRFFIMYLHTSYFLILYVFLTLFSPVSVTYKLRNRVFCSISTKKQFKPHPKRDCIY